MMRWSIWLASAMITCAVSADVELPAPDPDEPLEIEPPLLIGNRAPDGSIVVDPKGAAPADVDLARLESDLTRARKSAASGERLFRGGIIAKVEAEARTLKVVRLEAKLAEARLEAAKRDAAATSDGQDGQPAASVADAEAAAKRAIDERNKAELEAALRNLQRQQKLLALGSGRKSEVARAEKKLAELQHPAD